jgi:hypothetical protein
MLDGSSCKLDPAKASIDRTSVATKRSFKTAAS